jgi:Family of unknown function (DUF6194)
VNVDVARGTSIDERLDGMTPEDIIEFVSGMPGVSTLTASADNGAPEVAWGDSFFTYADEQLPFATIVVTDYPGFDTASDLDRPGVFRLNIAVGRARFAELLGFPPAAVPDGIDYTVLDHLLPHPVYASQSWISVLNPGRWALPLLADAHARAAARYRPGANTGSPTSPP